MEKRVKILYIITICAIVAFLAMQVYWLLSRYEIVLVDYEDALYERVGQVVKDYNDDRSDMARHLTSENIYKPEYSLGIVTGDTLKTQRTVAIKTRSFRAHDLLGLPEDAELTLEQKLLAADILARKDSIKRKPIVDFDASSAPNDGAAWTAAHNVTLELDVPFSADSMLTRLAEAGIDARVDLNVADTMVWNGSLERHASVMSPEAVIRVPYSELQCKEVVITCPIRINDVLPYILPTLVVMGAISLLLIICLVWQIATILKLSRLDKMRNGFVTTMIHELKRPISTLKMCVSGMENERMMSDPDFRAEITAESRNALDNLSAYFSKLRDIIYNDVQQIPLNLTQFSLSDLFDYVIHNTVIPSGKDAVITSRLTEPVIVTADRVHLANMLVNLVENALKYSGGHVDIDLSAVIGDNSIDITVTDNGNGIAAADVDRIFDRFYRCSDNTQPGLGLGLAYVRMLAQAHGGMVTVASTPAAGSSFTITLPR